jgi:hypothetical protein
MSKFVAKFRKSSEYKDDVDFNERYLKKQHRRMQNPDAKLLKRLQLEDEQYGETERQRKR